MHNDSGDGEGIFQDAGEEDFKVNFGNVGDPEEFKPIPRGDYNCIFDQTDYGISKSSGKPMITARLEIEDGEYTGRKLWTWLSFSEKALPFTKMAFSNFAPDLLEAGDFSPQKLCEDGELLGKKTRVKVDIEKFEGQDRNRVKKFLPTQAAQNEFIQQ